MVGTAGPSSSAHQKLLTRGFLLTTAVLLTVVVDDDELQRDRALTKSASKRICVMEPPFMRLDPVNASGPTTGFNIYRSQTKHTSTRDAVLLVTHRTPCIHTYWRRCVISVLPSFFVGASKYYVYVLLLIGTRISALRQCGSTFPGSVLSMSSLFSTSV